MSFWKKKDNLIITGFVVLFFAGLAVWLDLCCVRAAFFSPNPSDGFEVPFVDQSQQQLTLNQFKGRPVIINFWATWCPLCVKKMGALNNFAAKFEAQGGKVLAISQDKGGISKVRAFYARNGYSDLGIYIDATGHLLQAFGVRGLPTAIFIDAQGTEVGRLQGAFDWEGAKVSQMVKDYFGIQLSP